MEVVGLNQGIFASDMAYYHALKQNPQNDLQDVEDEGAAAVIWDDDSWAQNGVFAAGDDSFVDQLLNLEFEDGFFPVEDQGWEEKDRKDAVLHPPPSQPPFSAAPTTTTVDDLASVLSVPAEEADLEWVSQFMEDSNIPQHTYPTAPLHSTKPTPPPAKLQGQVTPLNCLPSAPLPLSKSRRSKRPRLSSTSGNIYTRFWPYPTSHFPTSSSSSASTASPPSSPSTPLAFDSAFLPHPRLNPTKKQKKSGGATTSSGDTGSSGWVRRCSHCGVQKTPQWRAGPMGAKTLCNACGVRFKSGRLFPEYRPACSPTFSSELHSNSHRKVLEMRKKKDGSGVPDSGIAPAVSSLG